MINNLLQYHLTHRIQHQISQRADRTAFRQWSPSGESQLTWRQVETHINRIASALLALGTDVQERIAIFANNCMAWSLADLAVLRLRGVSVPLYATNTPAQAAFIINDADIRILFVGEQAQLDAAIALRGVCPQLIHIIVFDDAADLRGCEIARHLSTFEREADLAAFESQLQQRIADCCLQDLFTLIYTSGTTGEPKGVMLDYRNLAAQLYLHDERLTVNEEDVSLSFLPMSHVFERAWSFFIMHSGAQNVFLPNTDWVREAMTAVRPTLMCAVPRFYEKIFSAVHEKVARAPWLRRALFHWAIVCGEHKFLHERAGKPLGKLFNLSHRWADKLVLSKLRGILGGRVRFLPAAGAKLDDNVILFFQAMGINIKYGYGMTETCATVSCWEEGNFRFGSIGKPLPGVEVRIGEENEIQVRGPVVMRGYFNKPLETAASFTTDGWLKTGDAGAIDEGGNLFITERLKDLMKTSGGKYIAPQMLEGTLAQDRFIEQVAIIADARKFVSALIVPSFESLEEYAKSINLKYQDRLELLRHSHILEMFESRLREMQKELARFEQVKRFTLLPAAFSMELGELTPTLKLRRKVILQRYQSEIDAMYQDKT
ncbi:AMP-dependent synthetase/ligase [Serratia quinivorans]|uniref:AMP-dependent synthetase/ligase n=1 Tax=Serratia quinivorans TaxID=137545 RepID=UPI002179E0C9|nr:long-chain fatty acid--CoA ligase [Serratia quinivorans]CAI0959412.1 Long-chain-fatty-acid--CoA ligase FadD15 [Serratia quinivorans]CAI0976273.1 Long-chain-fatty-acid--CoA ligase FadD15 [Serratia quinivorans]CAI1046276.1 Long-chain-fatty-acid--CoA ligase FadD15 [Serratia quinivorans]CAI1762901.1 Long-chain-fatty-acid--CoA ligase FadD15 [Serratia quinivorans]CAI2121896.1 Long-chain-fatty-acid--CoA ligase FadD15 [Serratia quinivorans]